MNIRTKYSISAECVFSGGPRAPPPAGPARARPRGVRLFVFGLFSFLPRGACASQCAGRETHTLARDDTAGCRRTPPPGSHTGLPCTRHDNADEISRSTSRTYTPPRPLHSGLCSPAHGAHAAHTRVTAHPSQKELSLSRTHIRLIQYTVSVYTVVYHVVYVSRIRLTSKRVGYCARRTHKLPSTAPNLFSSISPAASCPCCHPSRLPCRSNHPLAAAAPRRRTRRSHAAPA